MFTLYWWAVAILVTFSFAEETVDLTSIDWISKVPELEILKGILVPAGEEGRCKSFQVFYYASTRWNRLQSR